MGFVSTVLSHIFSIIFQEKYQVQRIFEKANEIRYNSKPRLRYVVLQLCARIYACKIQKNNKVLINLYIIIF